MHYKNAKLNSKEFAQKIDAKIYCISNMQTRGVTPILSELGVGNAPAGWMGRRGSVWRQ